MKSNIVKIVLGGLLVFVSREGVHARAFFPSPSPVYTVPGPMPVTPTPTPSLYPNPTQGAVYVPLQTIVEQPYVTPVLSPVPSPTMESSVDCSYLAFVSTNNPSCPLPLEYYTRPSSEDIVPALNAYEEFGGTDYFYRCMEQEGNDDNAETVCFVGFLGGRQRQAVDCSNVRVPKYICATGTIKATTLGSGAVKCVLTCDGSGKQYFRTGGSWYPRPGGAPIENPALRPSGPFSETWKPNPFGTGPFGN